MTKRAYLSNISAAWPIERQQATLATLPGWPTGFVQFRDELDARQRRRHRPSTLPQRIEVLRTTTRKQDDEHLYVASLAVLAWSQDDMMQCLTLALARGATVHVLDAGLTIPPSTGAQALHEAAVAFAAGKQADKTKTAGEISGAKRSAEARAKADKIRDRWPLPSADYPTASLIAEAGISLNTAKLHLGARPTAQREHRIAVEADAKRRVTRARRKEGQGT